MADVDGLIPRNYKPEKWVIHTFEKYVSLDIAREHVWSWLTDPKSFTRQLFPWRVEFTEMNESGESLPFTSGGFKEGVLNIHHGPLIHFAGLNTKIDQQGEIWIRDLHYFYGSFALNFRWIRPTRLTFELTETATNSSQLHLKVESYVCCDRTGTVWSWMQKIFWATFPSAVKSGANKKMKLAQQTQIKPSLDLT